MFNATDMLIAATLGSLASGAIWVLGFCLSARRWKGRYTVILVLPEHDSAITVHQVSECRHEEEALIKAAASKLSSSYEEASQHINTCPYNSVVFVGHFPYSTY